MAVAAKPPETVMIRKMDAYTLPEIRTEMARANAPAPINGLGIGFIGPTIIIKGTDWQKQRYLRKILTAEEI